MTTDEKLEALTDGFVKFMLGLAACDLNARHKIVIQLTPDDFRRLEQVCSADRAVNFYTIPSPRGDGRSFTWNGIKFQTLP